MCGAVDHLVKDCPKNARARRAAAEEATVEEGGARIDEGMEASSKTGERKEKKRREVVF